MLVACKLLVLLATSLAHGNSGRVGWGEGGNHTSLLLFLPEIDPAGCTFPCVALNGAIQSELLALIPIGIAVAYSLPAPLQWGLQSSKLYVQCYIARVLLPLWTHLLITHALFTSVSKAYAYAYALHASSQVLFFHHPVRFSRHHSRADWPHPSTDWLCRSTAWLHTSMAGLWHTTTATLCAVTIAYYAWRVGPGMGVAAWHHADVCGWSAHLVAVLAVELAQSLLAGVGVVVLMEWS
jgi:hypothetical protein